LFYEFEGRKYCEHDFQVLFAPCCGKCGEFVIGRVIKAMSASWHPACFCCAVCNKQLADRGFVRNRNRALCHECNAADKAVLSGKHICFKCQYVVMNIFIAYLSFSHDHLVCFSGVIDDKPLRFRGEVYHGYHFNCTACGIELNSDARELKHRSGYTANEMVKTITLI